MEIGSLVICQCAYEKYQDAFDFPVNIPAPGKIYTVRQIITLGAFKGVLLEEVHNRKVETIEFGLMEIQFDSTCFDVLPEADLKELKELL